MCMVSYENSTLERRTMSIDLKALANALIQFQKWQEELQLVQQECRGLSAADRLMEILYGSKQIDKLIGGCNAPILSDAAEKIKFLRKQVPWLGGVIDNSKSDYPQRQVYAEE